MKLHVDIPKVYDIIAEKNLNGRQMAQNAGVGYSHAMNVLARLRIKNDLQFRTIVTISKMLGVNPHDIMIIE